VPRDKCKCICVTFFHSVSGPAILGVHVCYSDHVCSIAKELFHDTRAGARVRCDGERLGKGADIRTETKQNHDVAESAGKKVRKKKKWLRCKAMPL
jgi:hypothetical protein